MIDRFGALWRRPEWWGALVVLLATQVVYLQTMTISVPFWDSGEFIATSYMLGIPHPPGTPLYVLIGRLFTLLPIFELAATKVNYLSALASSLAAVFMYWITIELYGLLSTRRSGGSAVAVGAASGAAADASDPPAVDRAWIGIFAGLVTAFFVAFSRTFWDNAIEAEVYALASLIMALCVWMALRWARSSGAPQTRNGWFVLLYYLICLSMGIHLGTFLVLPGIVLFMLLWDRRSFGDSTPSALLVAGLVILLHPGMLPTLGLTIWVPIAGGVAVASLVWGRKLPGLGVRGILTWCLAAAVLGMSTHLYLKIRAGLDPAINEADPETWEALWKVLTRDQYKPPNPFVERQAPWAIQFTKHFWDYARDQYSLGVRPAWLGWFLPYVMGLIGLVTHGRREKKTFALFMATYLIMSLGMVFYLNFKEDEVRERDYFFVASFQFFAVWIGLGAAVLLEALSRLRGALSLERSVWRPSWAVAAAGMLLVLLPFRTMGHFWFIKDRTEFYVARDFAANMLGPLAPNAILFTNGDNDTFPLWYLQFVEEVRPDVRVVNLSLLNTDWYMRQLRDAAPRIDLGWNDEQIDAAATSSGYLAGFRFGQVRRETLDRFLEATGLRRYVRSFDLPLLAKDILVARIVEQEWGKRPIYLALTVPDRMGLDDRLVPAGLALELREPGAQLTAGELTALRRRLLEEFSYRGILANGAADSSIYIDSNSRRLIQNYAASALQTAQELRLADRFDEAIEMARFAQVMAPRIPEVRYAVALALLGGGHPREAMEPVEWLLAHGHSSAAIHRLRGRLHEEMGDLSAAEASYRRAFSLAPDDLDIFRDLFSFVSDRRGDRVAALALVDEWLRIHPDDGAMRQARAAYAAGTSPR